MLLLEDLGRMCSVTFDEDTLYNEVVIYKKFNESGVYEDFFNGDQLDSSSVMTKFVNEARQALARLADHTPAPLEIYIEGLTEDTLVENTWTLTGTVTCNLELKWAGLHYKHLIITVDLVPAIPVPHWPLIARKTSRLLTDDIKSRGCHLVPKDGYWRLSFSLPESLIMAGLSQEQKCAFIGAKIVLHPAVSCKILVYDDDDHVSIDENKEGYEFSEQEEEDLAGDAHLASDAHDKERDFEHAKTLQPFDILSTYLIKNLFFNCIEENAKETSGKTITTSQIFSKLMEFLRESRPIPYYFIPNQYFSGIDEDSLLEDDGRDIVLVATVINSILNEG